MTARALGGKWVVRGESGEVIVELAEDDSESSEARATAPKPLAQRSSISRRDSGRGMKRLQCIVLFLQWHGRLARGLNMGGGSITFFLALVQKDELLDVNQHVAKITPCFYRILVLFLLLIEELERRCQLVRLRRARESDDVEV